MKKFTINFEHVIHNNYVAEVEAENYEQAMDLFEENPFKFVNTVNPETAKTIDYCVNNITNEDNKIVYGSKRNLYKELREFLEYED